MPDYNTLAMLAPQMVASMQRPAAPAPRKRGIFDRLFGAGIPDGLLSDEDRKGARQRALLMAGLGTMAAGSRPGANLGGALATGLMGGLQGGMEAYQQAAEGGMMQQKQAATQQVAQAREQIYAKYPPAPGETPVQMLQRFGRMLPEFMRIGDTEMVGKLTELLKSVGGPAFGIEKPTEAKAPERVVGVGEDGKSYYFERQPTGEWKNTGLRAKEEKPAGDPGLSLAQKASNAAGLGRQYNAEMKDIFDTHRLQGGAARDAQLALQGDVAAQTQLLYTFIKSMDPGSVVREGEIGLIQRAMPLFSRAQAWYQKSLQGEAGILDPKTAQQMLDLINRRRRDYEAYADEIRGAYVERASEYGISEKTFRKLPMFAGDAPKGSAAAVDEFLKGKTPHYQGDPMRIPIPPRR